MIVTQQYTNDGVLDESCPPAQGIMALSKQEISVDFQELDEKIKSMMVLGKNLTTDGKQKASVCQVCGKEAYSSVIKKHIEANHIDGVSIPCNTCNKIFRSRHKIRMHIERNHRE
jgi:hypothetical protein